jgi:hypothetical protein
MSVLSVVSMYLNMYGLGCSGKHVLGYTTSIGAPVASCESDRCWGGRSGSAVGRVWGGQALNPEIGV